MVTPKDAGSKPPRAPRPSKPLARTGKPLTAPEDTPAELVLPEAAPPSLADVLLVRPGGAKAVVTYYMPTGEESKTGKYQYCVRVGGAVGALLREQCIGADLIAGLGNPPRLKITIEAAYE